MFMILSTLIVISISRFNQMEYLFMTRLLLPNTINILFSVMSFVLGGIFGLDHFLFEKKKFGLWKLNAGKMMIALILLYFSMFPNVYILRYELFLKLYEWCLVFIIAGTESYGYTNTIYIFLVIGYLFQGLCGYILTKSFYKK